MSRGMRTQQVQRHEGEFGLAGLKRTGKGCCGMWWWRGGGHCNRGQIWKSLGCLVSSLDFITRGLHAGLWHHHCVLGRFLEGPEVWEVILGD